MVPHIRNILGGFLFSGDDVEKPVRVLSGGERTRLAVARMLLRPSNTLLLDEPTNHLDLDSKDVLLEALEDFGGTLIFVSHDRYFVDKLATKVIEIGTAARCSIRATTRSSCGAGSSRPTAPDLPAANSKLPAGSAQLEPPLSAASPEAPSRQAPPPKPRGRKPEPRSRASQLQATGRRP